MSHTWTGGFNINELIASSDISSSDYLPFYDISAIDQYKISLSDLSSSIGAILNVVNARAIWGYQDFTAGTISSTSVTLTTNSNGTSAYFDASKIISNR